MNIYEITFNNLGSARKNTAVTLFSALINSDHNAPHGFGFYNGEFIWKTADRANSLADLGDLISSCITTDIPIMSHVRLASKGIELKVENNHPFETTNFIGAHNGTLYLKDEEPYSYTNNSKADDNASRGSDSERFFNMLEAEYVSNGGKFYPAIQSVMAEHKGKFAFLIYEKPTKTFYVVRGKTADLHMVEVYLEKKKLRQYVGFIVNTEKSDLEKLTEIITNVWGLVGEKGFFTFGKIEELKQETIYAVKGLKLKEIGELKENPLYIPQPKTNHMSYIQSNMNYSTIRKGHKKGNSPLTIENIIKSIVEFQNMHFLTPHDMDLIFYKTLGIVASEAGEEELEFFAKQVMTKLHVNKDGRKVFRTAGIRTVPYYFYLPEKDGGCGLEFPWMLNKPTQIDTAIMIHEKKIKDAREQLKNKVAAATGNIVANVSLPTTPLLPVKIEYRKEGD